MSAEKKAAEACTKSSPCGSKTRPPLTMDDDDDNDSNTNHDVQPESESDGRGQMRENGETPGQAPNEGSSVVGPGSKTTNSASRYLGCLTRGARHRLSIPLPTDPRPSAANTAYKRRTTAEPGWVFSVKAAGNRSEVSHTTSPLSIVLHDADGLAGQGTMEVDHNTNAKRRNRSKTRKGKRPPAKIASPARRKGPTATPLVNSERLINFETLKPISVVCSPSGTGLLVKYTPSFYQSVVPVRRNQNRGRSKSNNACRKESPNKPNQDSTTNTRTLSPEKNKRVIPEDNSELSRINKHGCPSPIHKTSNSQPPFRNYGGSEIPGPSWAPDDLTQQRTPSTRRKASQNRSRGDSPRNPARISTARSASTKRLSPSNQEVSHKSARKSAQPCQSSSQTYVKKVYGRSSSEGSPISQRGKRRSSSKPPPNPVASEGWDTSASAHQHRSHQRENSTERDVRHNTDRRTPTHTSGNQNRWRPPDHGRDHAGSRSRSASRSPDQSWSNVSVMSTDHSSGRRQGSTDRSHSSGRRQGAERHHRRPRDQRKDRGESPGKFCRIM